MAARARGASDGDDRRAENGAEVFVLRHRTERTVPLHLIHPNAQQHVSCNAINIFAPLLNPDTSIYDIKTITLAKDMVKGPGFKSSNLKLATQMLYKWSGLIYKSII